LKVRYRDDLKRSVPNFVGKFRQNSITIPSVVKNVLILPRRFSFSSVITFSSTRSASIFLFRGLYNCLAYSFCCSNYCIYFYFRFSLSQVEIFSFFNQIITITAQFLLSKPSSLRIVIFVKNPGKNDEIMHYCAIST